MNDWIKGMNFMDLMCTRESGGNYWIQNDGKLSNW